MISTFVRVGLSCVCLSLLSPPALAHATFEVQQAHPGTTYKAVLRVPHGCKGAATTEIHIQMPEGYFNVKPMPHAGWQLKTVTGPYQHSYMNHGTEMKDGVTEIIWSDGNLPDAWYDEFVFRGTLADTLEPGSTLYFPTIQICATGENYWTVTADNKDGEPAPKLMLSAAKSTGETGGTAMQAASVTLGDLVLSDAYTRAMPPSAPTGGGFVTITNNGTESDRLVSVSSPAAKVVQIHQMSMENNVMVMRQMKDGVEIPAGATVSLAPGGIHIMFINPSAPFVQGQAVEVTLHFEKAGDVTLHLPVAALGATEMPAMKMN